MVTIKDVAKLAGVSIATVSRTLSRPEKVAEPTRKRVMDAVQKSGYVTNVLASNFRRRRTHSVVVLVPDIANPFYATIIQEIELVARRHGYQILLGETQQNRDLELSYGELAGQKVADGIISLGMHIPYRHRANRKAPDPGWPPLVMACEYTGDIPVPTVAIDNRGAAADATRHLLNLGHTDIGLLSGPEDFSLCVHRVEGFRRALRAAGIKMKREYVASGEFSSQFGYEAATRLLGQKHRPTALFCLSDELAIGVMSAAFRLGIGVPGDLSVVGFDDVDFAAFSNPPLTTIHQPMSAMGGRAMELMLQLLGGNKPVESRIILPHELVIRGSTQAPNR